MPNYEWDFPITRLLKEQPEKMTHMERVLYEVREERDKMLSLKKLKEIELLQTGKLASFGFTGTQLTGMGGNTMYGTATAGSPSSKGGAFG